MLFNIYSLLLFFTENMCLHVIFLWHVQLLKKIQIQILQLSSLNFISFKNVFENNELNETKSIRLK